MAASIHEGVIRARRGSRSAACACALAALALSGCAGVRKQAPITQSPAAETVAPVPSVAPINTEVAAAPPTPASIQERVEAHVVARMEAQPQSVQRAVAHSVLAESTRAGVDPTLVLAVIHVESSFKPKARSRAGAKGLMQVRPAAVREELGRSEARRANAYDPATNVRVGTSYLRRLIDRFGELETALMAYNAGPSRISAMLSRGRRIPDKLRRYPRHVMEELDRVRLALGIGGGSVVDRERIASSGPADARRARSAPWQ